MSITASAPGKLVLFGDHAVVYGQPALVTTVDIHYKATIEQTPDEAITIHTPTDEREVHINDLNSLIHKETAFVQAAVARVFSMFDIQTGLHITTEGPQLSYGLGSSSAITVATIAALIKLLDIEVSKHNLFEMAYGAVLDVQGKGSGVDIAAAVFGGTVYYVKGGTTLQTIMTDPLPLVIGYSGEKVSTTNLIDQVGQLRSRRPFLIAQVFDLMGKITQDARNAIEDNDWGKVGDLMNINQGLLDSLSINTPELFNLIFEAKEAGAYGAKLSGAGGGDCMFALVDNNNRSNVEEAINEFGEVVNLRVGVPGVTAHKNYR